MKGRINGELDAIEQEKDVRVLFAVESGSRAWGFPSPDSDYDVRFIYAHPRDWYVSVFEGRDVIEAMLPDSLDLVGWDLRKALRLLLKRNVELNEWLGSPILYREFPELHEQLLGLTRQAFSPAAALHHYSSMAAHVLKRPSEGGEISIKQIFYVLRPLLACRWVVRDRTQPPTSFLQLLESSLVTQEENDWMTQLLRRKACEPEAEPLVLTASQVQSLRQEVEHHRAAVPTLATTGAGSLRPEDLDAVLRHWAG